MNNIQIRIDGCNVYVSLNYGSWYTARISTAMNILIYALRNGGYEVDFKEVK